MSKLLQIHPDNPDKRKINQVVDCLKSGGIIIYPTDTIYGIGCDITNGKAIEKVCRLKGIDPKKANLAFVCYDLSHLSDYSKNFDKQVYKVLNKNLPGPFTFILEASKSVPKLLQTKKKTVGIRVPDNNIAREIVRVLGNPILTTSLKLPEGDELEYLTDPEEMYEEFHNKVDIVIDGGAGSNQPSTVVVCLNNEIEVVREGKSELIY
ncbi:UNVERIFIED_CONTAM: hypothetical protein GTU68_031543 [Idotea baltica]|nr:hypothetical protein [Idotea baltica]